MMKRTEWMGRALVGAALVLASGWTLAAPAIEAVTSSLQGGQEIVRVEFSEPLTSLPTGFVTQSPARVALDVPGATRRLPRSACS